MTTRTCKDCPPPIVLARPRPAPYPGPRCFTHHQAKLRADRQRHHEDRIISTYAGLKSGDYDRIWELQGKRCAVCHRTLKHSKKRPPLDHDHELNWARGILCQVCNKYVGYIGDDPDAARRLVEYLLHPPAWEVVGPPPKV